MFIYNYYKIYYMYIIIIQFSSIVILIIEATTDYPNH